MNNVKVRMSKILAVATLATTLAPTVAPMTNIYAAPESGGTETTVQAVDKISAKLAAGAKEQVVGKDVDLKGDTLNVTYKGKTFDVTLKGNPTLVDGKLVYEETVDSANGIDKLIAKTDKTAVKDGTIEVSFELGGVASKAEQNTTVKYAVKDVTNEDEIAASAFIGNVKIVVENGTVKVNIPAKPAGMEATIKVERDGNTVKDLKAISTAKSVELEKYLGRSTDYTAKIVVQKGTSVVKTHDTTQTVEVKDSKPVVNWAYVIDGSLVINATSKAGLATTPIFWKYSYEDKFKAISSDFGYGYSYNKGTTENKHDFNGLFGKVTYDKYQRLNDNDYRIPVEIPSRVQLVVIDKNGKELPVVLDINKDNTVLSGTNVGNAPKDVKDMIDYFTKGGDFVSVREKDMTMVKKDTTLNLYETFKAEIQSVWDSYNTRELTWKSEQLTSFDPFNIKFDKAGRYVFDITKNDSDKAVRVTVLVVEGNNNIKSFKIVKDPSSFTDVFKAEKAFEFVTRDKKAANPIGFYVKYDGEYYRLNDNIPFATKKDKENTKAEIVVKDILNNREHKITFVKKALQKMSIEKARAMFSDIKGHWAEDRIVTLVANGVIAGFPDGTFKPENKISIRETAAIMGRFASTLDADKVNKVENKDVKFTESTWGNSDVRFVLQRLPKNIFEGADLDKAITRDQVAYIMNHVFKYNPGIATKLSDVAGTRYENEINALTTAGSIKGYPDGTFKPADPISRSELCSMMFVIPGVKYDVITDKKEDKPETKVKVEFKEESHNKSDLENKLKDLFK